MVKSQLQKVRGGRRLRSLPINSLIPNMCTVFALCAGLTSIRFSLSGKWELAVMAIVVASLFDAIDGRLARLLKGSSKFGAELDSLSDFLGFGVAPSILLYRWTLNDLGGLGWILVLFFSVCCALRLARFNTDFVPSDQPSYRARFFVGVPAPAGAGLVLLPIILSFQFSKTLFHQLEVNALVVTVVALLMVSRLPTYSFKEIRVKREYILPLLVVAAEGELLGAMVWSHPWLTLTIVGVFYFISLPLSLLSYWKCEGLMRGWIRRAWLKRGWLKRGWLKRLKGLRNKIVIARPLVLNESPRGGEQL